MDLGSIALRAWGFESPLAHPRVLHVELLELLGETVVRIDR